MEFFQYLRKKANLSTMQNENSAMRNSLKHHFPEMKQVLIYRPVEHDES